MLGGRLLSYFFTKEKLAEMVTPCHSLSLVVPLVVIPCYSLSLLVICCHTLSFIVTRCVKDNKNNRWKRNAKTKQKRTKTNKKTEHGDGSYSKWVRDKCFCWAFKFGFLQLICKASSIFKWNLELAFSIILKERESYESY